MLKFYPAFALGLPQERRFLLLLTGLLVVTVLAAAAAPSVRKSSRPTSSSTFELGYLTASAIYVGTFLLSASYPYKLVFLILAIPQCLVWTRISDSRYLGAALLATILAMMWVPSFALVPGQGSEMMAAISVILFMLLGSTSFLIVLRQLLALRPDLTLIVATRLKLARLA